MECLNDERVKEVVKNIENLNKVDDEINNHLENCEDCLNKVVSSYLDKLLFEYRLNLKKQRRIKYITELIISFSFILFGIYGIYVLLQ